MSFRLPYGVTAIKTIVPRQEGAAPGVRFTWGDGGFKGGGKGEKA